MCHLNEELFGAPSQLCHHINDFENCIGSKPIEESKKESKNMMKCKYYSDYESGQYDFGICSYGKCKYNGFPAICTYKKDEENCTYFEPLEDKKEHLFTIGSSVSNQDLICPDCERVIFIGKKLGNVAEIDANKISKIDSVEVNGIKFKKG